MEMTLAPPRRVPLILVPAMFGSELHDEDGQMWPVDDALDLLRFKRLLLGAAQVGAFVPDNGTLLPGTGWTGMLELLKGPEWGYEEGRDLFLFTYDWRASVEICAARLKEHVEQWSRVVESSHVGGEPARFVMVCHSHGSVIARLYVDRLGGNSRVVHLLMLAAIEQGAPFMLEGLLAGVLKMPMGSTSRLVELAARLGRGRIRELVRFVPGLYQWSRMEGLVDTPSGPATPERLGFVGPEGRARWESGQRLLDQLIPAPSVPSTYLYGIGFRTPASYFLEDDASVEEIRAQYGAGDGVVLARNARSVDLRAGVDVRPHVRAHHMELLSHPETLGVLNEILLYRADPVPSPLAQRWWEALQDNIAFATAGQDALPLVVPIPSTDITLSPLTHELSTLRPRGAILLLGEQAERAAPGLLGWLVSNLSFETRRVLPLWADLGGVPAHLDGEAALFWAIGEAMSQELREPLDPAMVAQCVRGRRALIIVSGLDRAGKQRSMRRLAEILNTWRAALPEASWVFVDRERQHRDLLPDLHVYACLDGPRAIQIGCLAWHTDEGVNLEVYVGELPERLRGQALRSTSPPLATSWLLDTQTGALRQPRLDVQLRSRAYSVAGGERRSLALGREAYGMVTFSLRHLDAHERRVEIDLLVQGTLQHRMVVDLDDLADGGVIDPRWLEILVQELTRSGLAETSALDRLDQECGLVALQESSPELRLRARLTGFFAELRRREGAVQLLSWLFRARRLLREQVDAPPRLWILTQAIDDLQEILAPGPTGMEQRLQAIIDGVDLLPCSFIHGARRSISAVARIAVPRVRGGLSLAGDGGGTGWLLAPDLMVTALHVLEAREPGDPELRREDRDAQVAGAEIHLDLDDSLEGGHRLTARRLEAWDRRLDVAVLRLAEPVSGRELPPLHTARIEIFDSTLLHLNIVQHPAGKEKRIAIRENIALSANEHEIRYTTDTDRGSSGSPVFDDHWRVVALHRSARNLEDHAFNVGVQMSAVRSWLEAHHRDLWAEIKKSHPYL